MKALRRATNADVRHFTLIHQLALQTHMAHLAGEISDESRHDLLQIFLRCHTDLVIRSGVLDRIRQKRFNMRCKKMDVNKQFNLIVGGILLTLVVAWIYLI